MITNTYEKDSFTLTLERDVARYMDDDGYPIEDEMWSATKYDKNGNEVKFFEFNSEVGAQLFVKMNGYVEVVL